MNELQTITQVSNFYEVTPRMLRHYEKLGLIQSSRVEDYAYRMYDEENVTKIRQILFLRKLRLSLKEISLIINNQETATAMAIFEANIQKIDEEIVAHQLLRQAFEELIQAFKEKASIEAPILPDASLQEIIESIPQPKTTLKEELKMQELNKAEATLEQINPRIVYLPSCTVAASHYVGPDPEMHASQPLWEFIQANKLWEKKSDVRLFSFNHPNPTEENPEYGHECWVTIPDDLEVPAPLMKKTFAGGQYAAINIVFPNFQMWGPLDQWVLNSTEYDYRGDGNPENMMGALEEQLDAYTHVKENNPEFPFYDLLIPVRKK